MMTDALFANVILETYARDLRTEQLLDETVTDTKGYDKIKYTATKYSKAEKAAAQFT